MHLNRMIIFAALGLLLPSLALAQSDQRERDNRQEHQGGRPATPPNRPAPGTAQRPQQMAPATRPGAGAPQQRPGSSVSPHQPQARPVVRPPMTGQQQAHRPTITAQPLPPRGNEFWHRGQYHARVRGPAFRYPTGWGYRRWTIGGRLPPPFLAPAYFYAGWAALGLLSPPPGFAWVRYGPDLVEVNLTTGEIVDVIYGVFY